MNTTKKIGLLLLALSFSSAALAQGGVKPPPITPPPPTTPPPPITTPPTVQPGLAPQPISFQPTGGSTYALFFMNPNRIRSSPAQELATLQGQLSPSGLSPCLVNADVNASPIKCGGGLVQFGANELYSYGRPFNLRRVPLTLNTGVKQVFAANFRSPVGIFPGQSVGNAVHVHSNVPLAQFAMNFDSGQAGAPSISSVQFIVGTGVTAFSLPRQLLAPGTTQWAGVQVPAGFTDLLIVSAGAATNSQAFVADQFSVVTKAKFAP